MLRLLSSLLALASLWQLAAHAGDEVPALSGHWQLQWEPLQANSQGPLAQAHTLQDTLAHLPASTATLSAELRSSGAHWNATATLQQQAGAGQATQGQAWFNELALNAQALGWQLSAGKKIVAWDVGYAYRPNDVVQQEERRSLISNTAQGRPLLMAEQFDAERAFSLVWVNPTARLDARDATEPALAARLYQRQGSVDWHGFARWGGHTGPSLGAAAAWVASDALELHTSLRALRHADTQVFAADSRALASANPWLSAQTGATGQALVGGSWTNAQQLSLLMEAWWDGTAPSGAQWRSWSARNQWLAMLPTLGVPLQAVAGNLAWQADALNAHANLQRSNVYVRLSWDHEAWQPSLDVLYHPADAGRLWTAALRWQGDRLQWQGGLRVAAGPAATVLAQLPTRRQAFLSARWTF